MTDGIGGEAWIVAFTAGVAALSTLLILPPGIAFAWLLARHQFPGKSLVETLLALPLVMPPVATGLILLKLLGRRGPLGGFLHERLGVDVVFTWRGVATAMAVMSFPLLVRAARVAFERVDPLMAKSARTLGAGRAQVFFRVTLPLASGGVIGGTLLAFARALGEFGATVLVAGNIPGRTTTLSLAIYNLVQLGRDGEAFRLLGWSVALAFAAVWLSEAFVRRAAGLTGPGSGGPIPPPAARSGLPARSPRGAAGR
ncbi:MAG TPA: molybdate ABC transporter permease subunit [Thermoanaerobaculia bacterium]|nr:molybdate ABC transporter permease subunit [Thermoanaerobaculia bacterium]